MASERRARAPDAFRRARLGRALRLIASRVQLQRGAVLEL